MDAALQRSLNALRAFIETDNEQRDRVVERRRYWTETARTVILNSLTEITRAAGSHERGLYVHEGHLYDNLESLQLSFGHIRTGVFQRTAGDGGTMGAERGAALVFGQSEGGRIAVFRYPFSTTLPNEQGRAREGHEFVGAFEPEAVTRDLVLDQAKDFFDWAGSTSYRRQAPTDQRPTRIGFVPPILGDNDNGTGLARK